MQDNQQDNNQSEEHHQEQHVEAQERKEGESQSEPVQENSPLKDQQEEKEHIEEVLNRKACSQCKRKGKFLVDEGKQTLVVCQVHAKIHQKEKLIAIKDIANKIQQISVSPSLFAMAQQSSTYLQKVKEKICQIIDREVTQFQQRVLNHQLNYSEGLDKEDVETIKKFRSQPQKFQNKKILDLYRKGLKAKRRDQKSIEVIKILFKERSANLDSLIQSLLQVDIMSQICLSDIMQEGFEDEYEKSESRIMTPNDSQKLLNMFQKQNYISDIEAAFQKYRDLAQISVFKLNLDLYFIYQRLLEW